MIDLDREPFPDISEWLAEHAPGAGLVAVFKLFGYIEKAMKPTAEVVRECPPLELEPLLPEPEPKTQQLQLEGGCWKRAEPAQQPTRKKRRVCGAMVPHELCGDNLIPVCHDIYPGSYYIYGPTGLLVAKRRSGRGKTDYFAVKLPEQSSIKKSHRLKLRDWETAAALQPDRDWRYTLCGANDCPTTSSSWRLHELWDQARKVTSS